MDGDDAHLAALCLGEASQLRQPVGRSDRGAGERHPGQRAFDLRVIGQVAVKAPVGRAARYLVALGVLVPAIAVIQLRLVAELERLHPAWADPRLKRTGLCSGELGVVSLEVDPQDELRVQVRGERMGDLQPKRGEADPDPARTVDGRDWPPRPVGAVAADPDRRLLSGADVADQLQEHRVQRGGVDAGVRLDGREFERQAEKAGPDLVHGLRSPDRHGRGRRCCTGHRCRCADRRARPRPPSARRLALTARSSAVPRSRRAT